MVNGNISYFSLTSQQIGTLSVDVHDGEGLIVLKGIQSPPALRDASLRWFVILDHHAAERVGVLR